MKDNKVLFTFHFDSIKTSVSEKAFKTYKNNLHFTLILLKLIKVLPYVLNLYHLHSTLILLKPI